MVDGTARTSSRMSLALGAGAVVSAALLGAAGVAVSRTLVSQGLRADLLDELVLAVACAAGVLVALWYAVSAAMLVAATRPAASPDRRARVLAWCRTWGAPGMRRLAAGAAVTGLGLGLSTGAVAAPAVPDDLTWGGRTPTVTTPTAAPDPAPAATTARPTEVPPRATALPAATAATPLATTEPAPAASTHTVRTGDTLWDLAAADLPGDATDAEIARSWHRWYRTNHATIGADPDVLVPGQVLTRPASA